jgi:anti-anti-sigma factor
MDLEVRQVGAVRVLRPSGPITREEAEQVKAALLEAIRTHLGRVVLDVSAVTYVDSPALEALVEVTETLAAGGRALKLCAVNETLEEVLALTGLAPHFEQYEDASAAARSFL